VDDLRRRRNVLSDQQMVTIIQRGAVVLNRSRNSGKSAGQTADRRIFVKKLRIFVVEDEAIILRSICLFIEAMGNEVAGKAVEGLSAVEKIQNTHPDMVLVDINIPGKDGLTVVREACLENMIPTIVITGYFDDNLITKANCECVFGYMMKPVTREALTAGINIAWSRAEAYIEERERADKSETALKNRKDVERAKGILMDEFGVKEREAMKRLQNMAKNKRKKIEVIAQEIIRAQNQFGG